MLELNCAVGLAKFMGQNSSKSEHIDQNRQF